MAELMAHVSSNKPNRVNSWLIDHGSHLGSRPLQSWGIQACRP